MPVTITRVDDTFPHSLPLPAPPPSRDPVDRVTLGQPAFTAAARPDPPLPGPLERGAQRKLDEERDKLKAEEILAQMEVERKRSSERIRMMWAVLETECLKLWQEVMLERQKIMDDLFEKWCKVLLG